MKNFLLFFIVLIFFVFYFDINVLSKTNYRNKYRKFSNKNNTLILKPYLIVDDIYFYKNMKSYSFSDKHFNAFLKVIRQGGIDKKNISKNYNKVRIKNGSELMKYISYAHFKKFFIYIVTKSMELNDDDKILIKDLGKFKKFENSNFKFLYKNKVIRYILDGNIKLRSKVIDSMLGGVLNFDPRVRLISISFLRRLVVDKSIWNFFNKRIEGQKLFKNANLYDFSNETVKKTIYNYASFNPKRLNYRKSEKGIVFLEMLKLRRFISRFLLVDILKKDENLIKNMPKEVFYLLVDSIDNEHFCNIPINYFNNEEYVLGLILGLENSDKFVRDNVALSLIRMIRTKGIDKDIKLHIFKILLENKNYRSYLIDGWTIAESSSFSDLDLIKIMNSYINSYRKLDICVQDYYDQYDSKYSSSILYKVSKNNMLGKPVLKKDFIDNSAISDLSEEETEEAKNLNDKDINNLNSNKKINTIYIFG